MATDVGALKERLTEELPASRVLAGLDAHAYTIAGQRPPLVARPESAEELGQLLRLANLTGALVTPWGGGTLQALGMPPDGLDLVISLERLNRVLIHEPDDLTCSVEAGMSLADLNARLAEHNQMLPLDAPLPARASIGSLIATNIAGSRRLGYGTLRDLIIGIRVAHADGMLSKSGGMVVKNVSGYDMAKLYLGSLGTAAVVVSANFKLIPRPAAQATAVVRFDDLPPALATVEALLATQLVPTALDVLDAPAAAAVGLAGERAALLVRAEGPGAAVARTVRDVHALAERHGGTEPGELDLTGTEALWARVAEGARVANLPEDEAVLRVSVVPTSVPEVLADLLASGAAAGLAVSRQAQAGVGIVVARVRPAAGRADSFGEGLARLQAGLVQRWKNAIVLGCAPRLKPGLAVWGTEPSGLAVMRAIKQEFDPNRILNRGRFVGGI